MREIKIIYSKRKTISLQVTCELDVIVRAPKQATKKYIEEFVFKNEKWIEEKLSIASKALEKRVVLTDEQVLEVKKKASVYIKSRVLHFEEIMNVKSTSFKITSAKTRYGSCSYKNGLCFSYKTMLLPEDLIDYIVVHELAHIIEKNHSSDFYAVVKKYMPDYKERISRLKATPYN